MRRPFVRRLQCISHYPRPSSQAFSLRWNAVTRRCIQIEATPSTSSSNLKGNGLSGTNSVEAESPDARFEIIGAPYSLLSVSLSASQNLYTRRGTLVGVSGKADNTVSTLKILEPFRRALLAIPFLYQRISSTSPLTAFISVRSPITSFAVVNLNGTVDWMVAQRQALLAWTGHALSITPTINTRMSLAHWGNSYITGRGLLALAGKGQVYSVDLKAGEQFIAHPSNVVAYTVTPNPPRPYRFKSSTFRLQVPSLNLGRLLPDTHFFRVMRQADTWRYASAFFFALRTWSRRTIWGDRLFLQFEGPTTLLLQSRASRINEVLTNRDVNEIADTSAGVTQATIKSMSEPKPEALKQQNHSIPLPSSTSTSKPDPPPAAPHAPIHHRAGRLSVANVRRDGTVEIKATPDFQGLTQ